MTTLDDFYNAVIAGSPVEILKDIRLELYLDEFDDPPLNITKLRAYELKYKKTLEVLQRTTNPEKMYAELLRFKSVDSSCFELISILSPIRFNWTHVQCAVYGFARWGDSYVEEKLKTGHFPNGATPSVSGQIETIEALLKILAERRNGKLRRRLQDYLRSIIYHKKRNRVS